MAQNPRGTHNPQSNLTRKRPFANEHPTTQLEFVDSNPLGIQPSNSKTNAGNTPSPSSKRKRQQPPAVSSTTVATVAANNTNTTIGPSPSSVYINLPHKMPSQRSVPAFLHKLYNMVGDPSTDPFIRWSVDGNSFLVEGHEEFARLILPRFYKHNTFASFVRQLNMYDFHKVPHLQQGVLLTCNNNPNVEIWEFSSPNFQRSRPDLLILVTRKRNRDRQEGTADPVNLGALVKEISAIKKHQTNITADLRNLHRDNEIIWQETLAAREKHQKHQQVISKILQFLTAVFSNDHTMLTHLTNEVAVDGNQQAQQSTAQSSKHHSHGHKHTHSSSMKGLSKSISQCNVSSSSNRDSSCDSALGSSDSAIGSSDSGANSSDSGNSSGNGSGSDGDEESKPAASKAQKPIDTTMHDTGSSESTSGLKNNQDVKQKGKACTSPTGTVAVIEQPMLLSNDNGIGQPAARSAQAITNDIDQLQVNVETLAAQLGIDPTQFTGDYWSDLGGFSENYNGMINSASRADKRRLFDLADGKKKARHHPLLPQQRPSEYLSVPQQSQQRQHNDMHSNNTVLAPYIHEQHAFKNQDAYLSNDYVSPTDQLSNNHDFSFQLGHMLKAVDGTLKHHSDESGAASNIKETTTGYQPLDANPIHVTPMPSNVPPSSFSPHHHSQSSTRNPTSSSDLYNTYYNDNTLIYTTPDNKTTMQQTHPSFASVSPQNQHLYFHPDQTQQHTTVKNTATPNESHHHLEQVPHTTPYYVDPASIIPSQPPSQQQQQQHLYKQPPSLYQANSFSYPPQQQAPSLSSQSAMYAQQRRASANPVETPFLTDSSTVKKADRTAYC
ncbi:hypothetical protein MBANPS3_004541 [Mucor bainieri]